MNTIISTKELRANLPNVIAEVRRGTRFTVLYRNRPAFRLVPVKTPSEGTASLEDEPLYRAKPVGCSTGGQSAGSHDRVLYSN